MISQSFSAHASSNRVNVIILPSRYANRHTAETKVIKINFLKSCTCCALFRVHSLLLRLRVELQNHLILSYTVVFLHINFLYLQKYTYRYMYTTEGFTQGYVAKDSIPPCFTMSSDLSGFYNTFHVTLAPLPRQMHDNCIG